MTGPGRWPANVILSPEMARVLDQQTGPLKSGGGDKGGKTRPPGYRMRYAKDVRPPDEGGASRFFLNAGYEPWELEWIYSVGLRPCGMEEV